MAENYPRVVGDAGAGDGSGAVWRLEPGDRTLDANVINLPAGDGIARHVGPALDVLIHVIEGGGILATDGGDVVLEPGALVWLPKRSVREFTAGPEGLRYLSIHQRKPRVGLSLRGA